MALSRLQNFLNNPTGTTIFVDPNNFDATDSIENRGTSPGRPFISIQRALVEAARYSFQIGRNNDLNDRTTILVSPGTHYIDNRPGYSIENINGFPVYKKRIGKESWEETTLQAFDENSNFDIFDPNNDLYKYNSVSGGVILPRGTSIVGNDLRKTKIRPLYVPDPLDSEVERSSILNVTGSCYFSQFTFFDADPTKFTYKNYDDTKHFPKYSHHKLTTFVYADGVNLVRLGDIQTSLTDLDMYYYKLSRAYGPLSGRDLEDFPANLDFEPRIDEYRIVGALQENPLGITSIRAGNGDGTGDNSVITVTTANLQSKIEEPHNFAVDTPIIIRGITQSPGAYNGSFTVRQVVGLNTFTYVTPEIPSEVLPNPSTFEIATVSVESDTVSSSSPYIFNCSLRSVYGLCGMWADGSKATGFKSMVVAQFTGISLQKDDDAYLIYDDGVFYDEITLPQASKLRPLYQNSRSIFKPDFENFHIRASNDAFVQVVSVFAIGYAKHFLTESGADMSITNSNSNFGANALNSIGFKKVSFDRDDTGFITHIIPPKELDDIENEVSWLSLDIAKIQTISDPTKLYINSYNRKDVIPPHQVDSYRVGARLNDKLYLIITGATGQTSYSTPIFMTTPGGVENISSRKEYTVSRSSETNNITNNGILTLSENHLLFAGEKIRLFSNTAQAPDGIVIDKVYYAITTEIDPTLGPNQIKLGFSLNDALSDIPVSGLNNNGGVITVLSTVSDKKPGEPGHPIQWDAAALNWYINSSSSANNEIYTILSSINTSTFGSESPTTYIKRIQENRATDERLYKLRYVIPKEFINAKAPQVGFILQESKNVAISTISVDESSPLLDSIGIRNDKLIVNASAGSIINNRQTVTITTELPHYLIEGDTVKIQNITSSNNSSGVGIVSTFNGEYNVDSTPTSRTFTYTLTGLKVNPGTFINNINQRVTRQQRDSLPLVSRQSYKNNFYIYNVDTIKNHISGSEGQDGIYHLTVLSSTIGISDNIGYGLSEKYFNQDIRNLYPQVDRDNAKSDPEAAISYADLMTIGKIITDDKKKSITLESISEFTKNNKIGFGITNVSVSGIGNTTVTIFTDVEHKLNSIRDISVVSTGSGYPSSSTLYSKNLIDLLFSEEDATCSYTTTVDGSLDPNTINVIDVGSAHTVGERLGVQGASISNAIVEVTKINNNIGDGLQLSGFIDSSELNGVYKITNIPNKRKIEIYVPNGVNDYSPNLSDRLPFGIISSKGIAVSSMILSDLKSGISTVTTSYPHGLFSGNKIKFVDSNLEFYNNKDYTVLDVVGINTFTFNVGVATTTTTPTTGRILKYGISSNKLNLGRGEENIASRACILYTGLSAKLTSNLNSSDVTINVDDISGIDRGDFIVINNEILRISTKPIGNTANVLRNQLGTIRTTAVSGSVIKKIRLIPVETRRPSFMRASGHTFEYLGFGPGNYSTALPQRQDRILEEVEVLTSQAKKQSGGTIVYTGMNDLGEFFTGSKKISATTAEETIIEAPILTYTGDDVDGTPQTKQSGVFDEILVRNRITVEGGDNNDQSSQFYGPVTFNKRITNLSTDGILTRNLYIRGSVSQEKLLTVGISTPTTEVISNPRLGYISLISDPSIVSYVGHIYKDNEWRQFGLISNTPNELNFTIDKLGIGADADDAYPLTVNTSALIKNLEVTGGLIVTGGTTLADVTFEDVSILGTALFPGFNPISGLSTTYTQIHERGTSLLNQIESTGISTFYKDVYVTKSQNFGAQVPTLYPDRVELPNIRIGIANSNQIDTKYGDLIFDANSDRTVFNTNVLINNGNVSITSTRSSGIATAYIENSSSIRLGVGNTNQNSFIDLNNDTSTFSNFGLRLIRNSGIGSQSSSLIHRGTEPLFLTSQDNADVRILTNNQERIRVGSSGTITIYQNNSGPNTRGAHLRLTQAGIGDVVISLDTTNANVNRRWYQGIDVSDDFSWKLATPLNTVPYNNENFNFDTKIRVGIDGDLTFTTSTGIATVNATNIISSSTGTFNLLNSNISSANILGDAESISIAKNTETSTVTIRGATQSSNTSTGALVVSGGVAIAKNINVGGSHGNTNISGTLSVSGVSAFGDSVSIRGANKNFTILDGPGATLFNIQSTTGNVNINSTTQSSNTSTGALVVSGGVAIAKDINVGGSHGNTNISGFLAVAGVSTFSDNVTIRGANKNFTILNNLGANSFNVNSDSGNTSIRGTLSADGNTNLGGTLTVSSNTTINGNLTVSGISSLPNVIIDGGSIDGTTLGSTVRSSAKVTSLDVNQNSTFNGAAVTDLVLQRYGEVVVDIGTGSGARTLDLNAGNVFLATINGNTSFTFSNVLSSANSGSSFTLILRNAANSLSVSWPTNVKFPNDLVPLRTTDSGRADIWIFITPDQGTTWYGTIALYNMG